MERYRLQEWLTFIGTEIHRQLSPLFIPSLPEEAKPLFRQILDRLAYVDRHLAEREYLFGNFTVADGNLYTVARWTMPLKLDISGLKVLYAFMACMKARPAVQRALKAACLLG